MVNYQQKYIKYREKYLNLKNYKNMYGGAPKFVKMNGEQINIDYNDDRIYIEYIKILIAQQLNLPYWFLINIISEDGKVFDNNVRLVDIFKQPDPRKWQEINTIFTINISGYDVNETELLDAIFLKDRERIREIIERTPNLSDYILHNKAVLLLIIDLYGYHIDDFFCRIPEEYRNDKSFILDAINKTDYSILQHTSAALKADRDVVLAAVTKNGQAFQYAIAELRADKEIILAARKHTKRHAIAFIRNAPFLR